MRYPRRHETTPLDLGATSRRGRPIRTGERETATSLAHRGRVRDPQCGQHLWKKSNGMSKLPFPMTRQHFRDTRSATITQPRPEHRDHKRNVTPGSNTPFPEWLVCRVGRIVRTTDPAAASDAMKSPDNILVGHAHAQARCSAVVRERVDAALALEDPSSPGPVGIGHQNLTQVFDPLAMKVNGEAVVVV